ncbi:MAG: hypothetical protein ABH886_06015 [Candidatus Desantisbacteria bacterium]
MKCLKMIAMIGMLGMMGMMAGCVTQITLVFRCDNVINEGLLLPVDVILVTQEEEKAILQIGPNAWFESEYRNNLAKEQIVKLALVSGETKEIPIDVSQQKGVAIIFADYTNLTGQDTKQLVIHSPQLRGYATKYIRVGEKGLGIGK